jgi:hypothetical protein
MGISYIVNGNITATVTNEHDVTVYEVTSPFPKNKYDDINQGSQTRGCVCAARDIIKKLKVLLKLRFFVV